MRKKTLLLIGCLLFLVMFIQKGDTTKLVEAGSQIIEFNVKRNGAEFRLENVTIDPNFGKISSISIKRPADGMNHHLSTPAGWVLKSQPTDAIITYFLTNNNTPANVKAVLEQLTFPITNENKTEGSIEISINSREIVAWDKHPDGKTHYYEFVNERMSWLESYNRAKDDNNRHKGLKGYLATITSAEEHDFIYTSIANPSGITGRPGYLGGTRMTKANGQYISDDPNLKTTINDYDISKERWYWADGPEAGKGAGSEFFIGKTKEGPWSVPSGAYNGWSSGEPNNRWTDGSSEYVLQFALFSTKWWNDLRNADVAISHLEGYYVEYSEYGDQKELDDNGHSAFIPQKVRIQYRDQDTNEVLYPEVETIDNGNIFSIGDDYDTTSFRQDIEGYDRINPVEQGKYSEKKQTIIYYYKLQQLTFHIQQVLLDTNSALVIPDKGYAVIRNVNALKPEDVTAVHENINVFASSLIIDGTNYQDTTIIRNPIGAFYQIEGRTSEYYENLGYVLTDSNIPHDPIHKISGFPTIDSNTKREYWLTFYMRPISNTPKPYSWHYQQQTVGEFK